MSKRLIHYVNYNISLSLPIILSLPKNYVKKNETSENNLFILTPDFFMDSLMDLQLD